MKKMNFLQVSKEIGTFKQIIAQPIIFNEIKQISEEL